MKLLSYFLDGVPHWGCVDGEGVIDLGKRMPEIASVAALLDAGDAALARAREICAAGITDYPISSIRFATPIAQPRRAFLHRRQLRASQR